MHTAENKAVVILIPVFNDWEAAGLLLNDLDGALAGFDARVLFVDDGSTLPRPARFGAGPFHHLREVTVLQLRRNLGHQRAIAVGLVFVYQQNDCRAVVVMDGDGEDRPADIPALARALEQEQEQAIVFAARSKRLEGLLFRGLYQIYRAIHWLITGDPVRVGNFSMVPFESLAKIVVVPEIWNHYAAAVVRARLRFTSIPIARGRRLAGQSKMNFIGLLLHGLSAFFVYGDIVGARLLVAIAVAIVLEMALAGFAAALRWGIPAVAVILGLILLQAIPLALTLVFSVIGSRANVGFLPLRDCPYYAGKVERLFAL
jgi:hypothetical protein